MRKIKSYNYQFDKQKKYLLSTPSISFTKKQVKCALTPKLRLNIRGSHKCLFYSGIEPATRRAYSIWRGDKYDSVIHSTSSNYSSNLPQILFIYLVTILLY